MAVQDPVGQVHEPRKDLRPLVSGGEQGAGGLSQVVVGRGEADAGDVAVVLDRQLPEGGEGVNLHLRLCQGPGEAGVVQQGP